MKGIFFIPAIHKDCILGIQRYYSFFKLLKSELGFDIVVCDNVDASTIKADVVVLFKSPENWTSHLFTGLLDLPKSIKLIGYWADIHLHQHTKGDFNSTPERQDLEYILAMNNMLDRCDVVLCSYKEAFNKMWGRYSPKFVHFPHFVDRDVFRNIPFNHTPQLQCVVSGATSGGFYPIRKFISEQKDEKLVVLPHPGYGGANQQYGTKSYRIGEEYFKELNKYFCAVSTSGVLNYLVCKYFEIPAAGSLLLAEKIQDLDTVGFVENQHYLTIYKDNFLDVVLESLSNPLLYHTIRKEARNFVLTNHTNYDRLELFKKVLNDL